jgi:hypothetical protein
MNTTEIKELMKTFGTHLKCDPKCSDNENTECRCHCNHLQDLDEAQFSIVLPFLSQKIKDLRYENGDPVFSSHTLWLFKMAKFVFLWEIFQEDWKNYPDKNLMDTLSISRFSLYIGTRFNFRICFSGKQKEALHHIRLACTL